MECLDLVSRESDAARRWGAHWGGLAKLVDAEQGEA
jgi:hypothetical protein